MTHLVTALLSLLGFVLLLISMARHQQDWLARKLSRRVSNSFKTAGFAMLIAAFACAGFGLGWAYGAVAWCGWLSLGAALTLTAQTNRERILALLRR